MIILIIFYFPSKFNQAEEAQDKISSYENLFATYFNASLATRHRHLDKVISSVPCIFGK